MYNIIIEINTIYNIIKNVMGVAMYHKKKKISKYKWIELFFACLTIAVLAYTLIGEVRQNIKISQDKVSSMKDGWYYLDGNQKVSVQLPAVIEKKEGESLLLYNDSLSEKEAGKTLTTKAADYNLKILFDGQILYEYSDDNFPRNAQMKRKLDCNGVLPSEMEEGTVVFQYQNTNGGIYRLNEIFIGTEKAVFEKHVKSSVMPLTISFVMLVLAFLAMGVQLYLYYLNLEEPRFLNMAAFLVICSIWCLTDSAVFQQISANYQIICIISFYAFMLMSIPMIHFVKNTGNLKNHKELNVIIAAFYLNAILQGILNSFHVFEYIEMLFVTHLLLIIGVLWIGALLYKEYKSNANREIRSVILAFVLMAACGVLALLLYWLLEISYYSVIFELGILIFVFILMNVIILNMADNFRFKAEMVIYQRLAMEDRLTGIGNRRAFDEKVYELMLDADQYDNIVLIFMDLNGLKKVNDTYGHNAGDEMIIASSRCIRNTFMDMGFSYRIGGDEFCVLIPNPTGSKEEWFEKMDHEISIYNQRNRYKISIARGLSYLRDDDGNLKTISDWKYEADQNMYRDKAGRKQR